MPDWSKEIRAAIASLNLEPAREAELVEELAQHLGDRYDEMLSSGIGAEQAYQALCKELNGGTLVSGLKTILPEARPPLPTGEDASETCLLEFGATCVMAPIMPT
jgi:hypothetical protein